VIVVYAAIIVLISLLVDIFGAIIDPRIRLYGHGRSWERPPGIMDSPPLDCRPNCSPPVRRAKDPRGEDELDRTRPARRVPHRRARRQRPRALRPHPADGRDSRASVDRCDRPAQRDLFRVDGKLEPRCRWPADRREGHGLERYGPGRAARILSTRCEARRGRVRRDARRRPREPDGPRTISWH